MFYDSSTTSGFPAVTFNTFGRGHAAAFAYDLMRSIIETRQGNWRSPGGSGTASTAYAQWICSRTAGWMHRKNGLNQADEQMRLLSRLIETMAAYRKPLPSSGIFPMGRVCYVVLTNDTENNTGAELDSQVLEIENKGAGMTLYVLDTKNVTKAQTDRWVAHGHEVAAHPDLSTTKSRMPMPSIRHGAESMPPCETRSPKSKPCMDERPGRL